jgi:hypothetical protein
MTGPKVVGTIPDTTPEAAPTAVSDKPTKPLPTDRIGFQKQLALLRGYAALATQGTTKIVTNPDVAALVKIHQATSILAHPFFLDVGFLRKEGVGYVPAPEVLAYGKAFNWNPDTAPQKLAPVLQRTWFAAAILPRLVMGPLQEREAIETLADASGAGPRYEGQLKTALEYLVLVALVRRDGDTYRQAIPLQEEASVRPEPAARAEPEDDSRPIPVQREQGRGTSLSTAFSQAPEGVLRFNVDVSVDMKEFATWRPERISAFWAGIAQVLAAKAAVEQKSNG